MTSKPMLNFLRSKLGNCCKKGTTSAHESGLTVSIKPLSRETVLFFHIDSNEGRKSLNMMEEGLRACDYLVYFTEDGNPGEVICFLELKGSRLDDAIKQVLSTHKNFLSIWEEKMGKKQQVFIAWKVCICLHGQAPRNGLRMVDQLKKTFDKKDICIKHGTKQFKLLGEFLRS